MRTFPRLALLVLGCAVVLAPAARAAAALRKVRIPASALSPLITQQADRRIGALNGAGAVDAFYWGTLDLPVGATIKGMSYRRFAAGGAATDVGLDRVQAGATPAWQRVFAGPGSDVTPPNSNGTVVIATATGVPRRVARGWRYFVLARASPGAFVGEIQVRYTVP